MVLDSLVYSSEIPEERKNVLIFYSKRANAPVTGSVFTARVLPFKNNICGIKERNGGYIFFSLGNADYELNCFKNYTGYVKANKDKPGLKVETGKYYRFKIVAGPHTRKSHNYYYAIPLRELGKKESKEKSVLDAQDYLFVQRLGEFLLGIRFNRNRTISRLKEEQRNWYWFYKNFG